MCVTIFRTSGSTNTMVGNATTQEKPQDFIHVAKKTGEDGPTPVSVEISVMTKVMMMERNSGITI